MPRPTYSLQLFIVLFVLVALTRYLVKERDSLSDRQFVTLSVLISLLGVAAIGTAFRTTIFAWLLGLPPGPIDDHRIGWIKAILALIAAALSVHETARIAQKRPVRGCWSKGIALGLAVAAIGAYFRFGDPGAPRFYHGHELFHYYLGSKYDRELGYERIYRCVSLAQADSGQIDEVRTRKMMDLATDLIVPAKTALEHPEECSDRFTPERWGSFKADVMLFRRASNLAYWNGMQTDHGYNPPPIWTVMGRFWSSLHAPTDGYLQFLASFDLLLFAAMFGAIGWAFGWRVFSVAAIFWGCQAAAEYYWTGGAFLRQDWLFFLVLSACLVKKRHYVLGGAAFAYATLLRVFPGVLLVGWAVVAGRYVWRHKRMAQSHVRVMLGGLIASAALVSISAAIAGPASYSEFYKHILVHKHTPLTNNMGLETVLSQSRAGREEVARDGRLIDPYERWKAMRHERLAAFRSFHVVLLAALGIAFVSVVRRVRSLWIAQALSLAFVVSVVELTCYYYSLFILAALLSRLRKGIEQWVLAVAGASQLLSVNRYLSSFMDDKYVAQSVLFYIFAVSLIFAHWPQPKRQARTPEGEFVPE
jgi:hypothetical protein